MYMPHYSLKPLVQKGLDPRTETEQRIEDEIVTKHAFGGLTAEEESVIEVGTERRNGSNGEKEHTMIETSSSAPTEERKPIVQVNEKEVESMGTHAVGNDGAVAGRVEVSGEQMQIKELKALYLDCVEQGQDKGEWDARETVVQGDDVVRLEEEGGAENKDSDVLRTSTAEMEEIERMREQLKSADLAARRNCIILEIREVFKCTPVCMCVCECVCVRVCVCM